MADRASWDNTKARRRDTPERRRGYQEANDTFDFGARIRSERKRLGLTQAELAEGMGTTQPTVARLEAGGVTPGLDTLHRAAAALGMELAVDFRPSEAQTETP